MQVYAVRYFADHTYSEYLTLIDFGKSNYKNKLKYFYDFGNQAFLLNEEEKSELKANGKIRLSHSNFIERGCAEELRDIAAETLGLVYKGGVRFVFCKSTEIWHREFTEGKKYKILRPEGDLIYVINGLGVPVPIDTKTMRYHLKLNSEKQPKYAHFSFKK